MQNIVTLGEINDALKIAAVTAAQLADMGFAALANKPICEGLPPEESRRLRNAKLYPAESIGQIRVALAQRFAEPATAADVPASGAAALSEYLKTCEQHAIVPDVGGAFASAFAAGLNLAASQAAQPEATAAIKTLQNLGYTYHGAELWKPPIGKVPDFDLIDSLRNRISELEASQAAPAAVAVPDERAAFERELIDNHHYVPSDFSFKDGFYGGDDDYIQFGWDVWKARAALAATPAANSVELHQIKTAAPVVLPEPDAAISEIMELVEKASVQRASMAVLIYTEQPKEFSDKAAAQERDTVKLIKTKLRALLAGASAPAAQAEPVAWLYTHKLGSVQAFTTEPPPGLKAQCQPLYTTPQAQADARDAGITWPKARDVGRFDDMSPGDSIRVGLDNDNDVYVSVCGGGGVGSVEFCNPGGGGGGKSSRTRLALLALMVAMEADNAEDPSRDWWARSAAQAAQQGGDKQ
ncbi:hypothetical protein QYQ99_03255 [Comamonas testosteroni]|uniref:hypothetical protein n=1 Tax=Comamonas testosteroni TaxID=285 RepID=UPI00265E3DDA|nr:hypothetical protein [Comamonas testosteroni]WKL16587.1 hypothetical protein QYQ99_03255 [Comamonas testosteroni]